MAHFHTITDILHTGRRIHCWRLRRENWVAAVTDFSLAEWIWYLRPVRILSYKVATPQEENAKEDERAYEGDTSQDTSDDYTGMG